MEVHDPPNKPYKPAKPNDQNFGYGNTNNGQSYGQSTSSLNSQNSYSQSNHFDSHGSHFEDNYGQNYNKPDDYHKPSGLYDSHRPSSPYNGHKPSRPFYGVHDTNTHLSSYGSQSHSSSHLYSQHNSHNSYGISHKPSSSTKKPLTDSYYGGQRPQNDYQKPGVSGNKPSYDSSSGSYDSDLGSYGSSQASYGANQASYGTSQGSYSSGQASYGGQGSFNRPQDEYQKPEIYGGSNKPSYDNSGYGSNQGSHESDTQVSYGQGSYGGSSGSYSGGTGSYESNKGTYGTWTSQGSYDSDKNKPDYEKPETNNSGGYNKPVVKPVYEYELDKPHGVPSYIVRPDGQVIQSKPVAVSDYGERRPGLSRDPAQEVSYKGECTYDILAEATAWAGHIVCRTDGRWTSKVLKW